MIVMQIDRKTKQYHPNILHPNPFRVLAPQSPEIINRKY